MKTYSPMQYLAIDVANHYGMDKELFETRIDWVKENLNHLGWLTPKADKPILFSKAVMALRDALAGKPSGHLIGLDACASGPQIIACFTGCYTSAMNVGLIDPDVRADLYTNVVGAMNMDLAPGNKIGLGGDMTRAHVKDACVPFFYGSKAKPKEIFTEGSEAYNAFFSGMHRTLPGVIKAMEVMEGSWQKFALYHAWDMDDGYHVHAPVMDKVDTPIEVDELGGARFTHRFTTNQGSYTGTSLQANITHSTDGLVVREMSHRCNHDKGFLEDQMKLIEKHCKQADGVITSRDYMPTLGRLEKINSKNISLYAENYLRQQYELIQRTMDRKSFEMVSVHDEFKCLANYGNELRQTYIDLMVEIAQSNMLQRIINQVRGTNGKLNKESNDLAEYIKGSNYALS